jgi:hypothetical protein
MPTFNAANVIDKNLFTLKNVKKFYGSPESKQFKIVPKNQFVGRVYSYVIPKGQSALYWQFNEGNKTFFVKHALNTFDVRDLQTQGAKTNEQIQKEAQAAADKESKGNFIFYVEKYAPKIALAAAAVYLLSTAIKSRSNGAL